MATVSIADTSPRVQYTVGSTGTTGPWTITFPFFNLDDVIVYQDAVKKTRGVDYSVSGTAVDDGFSGGTVTWLSSISSVTLTILRDIPVERTTDFPTSGYFDIGALNTALDKIIAIQQELETKLLRTVKLADTDANTTPGDLPAASDGKAIYWAGTVLANRTADIEDLATVETSVNASKAAAETAATNAAASQSAAATSAAAASASQTAAASSATAAASSATTAGAAETAAVTAKTGAETAQTAAASSQTAAASSATAAATSESNAATSATAAASSETSAATAKTAAEAAQTAAETAKTSAEATYDSFDDRMLGAKSSDPATDNDGDALQAGTQYFNTTSNAMRVYSGSGWQDIAPGASDYLALTGGTMTGDLVLDGDPTTNLQAATKQYVDNNVMSTGKSIAMAIVFG